MKGYHLGEPPGQPKQLSKSQMKNIREKCSIPSVSQTRIRKTDEGKKVFKKPEESPVNPNDVTRKEQEPAKEITI